MGKLPRFHAAAGKLFDRAKFLDGTYTTYFVPEQWPFGMHDNSYVGYKNPTQWPRAGFLLRPPQVVCISFCAYPDYRLHPFPGDPLAIDYCYAGQTQEFDYLQIAIDTKIAIETLRPELTSIGITAYLAAAVTGYYTSGDESELGQHPYNSSDRYPMYPQSLEYYNSYFNFNYQLGGLSYLQYLVAPNPQEDFFGVDFLHLFIYNDPFFTAITEPGIGGSMQGQYYQPGKTRVINSYSRFAGYNVIMYSMPWLNGVFGLYPANVAGVLEICTDMADYGYSYGGDAQTEFTVSNTVDLIAKHFHFDPTTGKDLPVI